MIKAIVPTKIEEEKREGKKKQQQQEIQNLRLVREQKKQKNAAAKGDTKSETKQCARWLLQC